jgi:uncharacterized membrane protein
MIQVLKTDFFVRVYVTFELFAFVLFLPKKHISKAIVKFKQRKAKKREGEQFYLKKWRGKRRRLQLSNS